MAISPPYAKALMQINGATSVTGGQIVAGGSTVQLLGENTSQWTDSLWEIYDYPPGFTAPSGWNNINGIYQSAAVTPTLLTLPPAATKWGKYMFRLTVNNGYLNGAYHGVTDPQPLIYEASAVHVKSPNLGLSDIAFRETNQFNPTQMWIGELKATLRQLDTALTSAATLGAVGGYSVIQGQEKNTSNAHVVYYGGLNVDFVTSVTGTPTQIFSFPSTTNRAYTIRGTIRAQNSPVSAYGEWDLKCFARNNGGTLSITTATPITQNENQSGFALTFQVSGTNLVLMGTDGGTGRRWTGRISIAESML